MFVVNINKSISQYQRKRSEKSDIPHCAYLGHLCYDLILIRLFVSKTSNWCSALVSLDNSRTDRPDSDTIKFITECFITLYSWLILTWYGKNTRETEVDIKSRYSPDYDYLFLTLLTGVSGPCRHLQSYRKDVFLHGPLANVSPWTANTTSNLTTSQQKAESSHRISMNQYPVWVLNNVR